MITEGAPVEAVEAALMRGIDWAKEPDPISH